MKISLQYIKQHVAGIPADLTDQQLIQLIGSRLVEVEGVEDLAPKYQKAYIVKVVSAAPIEGTHLQLCQIDAGPATTDFLESTDAASTAEAIGTTATPTIQVVCGAPNVHAGMLAVWLAPGAIVPATYHGERFRLSVRKLRGYESHGMLAALDELDLGTDHEGIIEIDPKSAHPGDSFADVFGLGDLILDVENKSLTHRPDCFGLIGFAREVAGILGLPFKEPEWPTLTPVQDLPLQVQTDPDLCPRYSCAVFDLPDTHPAKYLTPEAIFLAKAGMRTIDPVVDLTNILMLETGQPLHAFDYDKLVAVSGQTVPTLIVRSAQPDEPLQLLDGKTIQCTPDDILITANNVPVALAGAMGGKNTEIDPSTRRVVLESATFSLYHLRKTQMAHGIFSEAITRFTKGQPAALTLPVLAEAVQRLSVQPLAVVDDYPRPTTPEPIKLTVQDLNQLLGTAYSASEIAETLQNVGFDVRTAPLKPASDQPAVPPHSAGKTPKNASLRVTAPVWRTDIHIPADVIEEVGRLRGYDNIPLTLPTRPFLEAEIDPMFHLKHQLRDLLSDRLGLHEALTYSFISRQLLEKTHLDPTDSYEITNSISPELQCFRQQITPSLLDKIRENLKSGHRAFGLYELNQVSQKSFGLTPERTPVLRTDLGLVLLGDFYALKARLLALFHDLKLPLEYAQLTPGSAAAEQYPYLEPAHSAVLTHGDQVYGAFGEIRHSVLTQFKLDQTVSACELNLDPLLTLPSLPHQSFQHSKFPAVERDLTLKVSADLPYGRALNLLDQTLAAAGLHYQISPLSIYQATPDNPTKHLSFHLRFSHPDRTLDAAAISAIMESITVAVSSLGATVI